MYIVINKIDRNAPALETSQYRLVDDLDSVALENHTTDSYFCSGGHSFVLAFEDVKPTPYFECPTCTALAVNNPEALHPVSATASVLKSLLVNA